MVRRGEIVGYKKCKFQGHVYEIESTDDVEKCKTELRAEKKIAKATHPHICAWRIEKDVHGFDDNGESGAGKRLLDILVRSDRRNTFVAVSRCEGSTEKMVRAEHQIALETLMCEEMEAERAKFAETFVQREKFCEARAILEEEIEREKLRYEHDASVANEMLDIALNKLSEQEARSNAMLADLDARRRCEFSIAATKIREDEDAELRDLRNRTERDRSVKERDETSTYVCDTLVQGLEDSMEIGVGTMYRETERLARINEKISAIVDGLDKVEDRTQQHQEKSQGTFIPIGKEKREHADTSRCKGHAASFDPLLEERAALAWKFWFLNYGGCGTARFLKSMVQTGLSYVPRGTIELSTNDFEMLITFFREERANALAALKDEEKEDVPNGWEALRARFRRKIRGNGFFVPVNKRVSPSFGC
eukprot:g2773.t1